MDTNRLETFSDGVIAIAITLLVLEIDVPTETHGDLWAALLDQWPSYLAYLISFAVIGIIWVNHHGILALVARVDRPLLYLNLLLLLAVAGIPFPTAWSPNIFSLPASMRTWRLPSTAAGRHWSP